MSKPPKRADRGRPRELYRVNHRIRVPEVRVVLEDGEQLGILSREEALRTAQEKGLDLVEITARSNPPVCRIMDYGRFKYEQSKKAKQAKKHSSTVELKEIKFRPKTEEHDLDFKIKHITRFLEDGNKCRLVVVFRGREVVHPKTGVAVLDKVLEATKEISQVEVRPNLEGKRMIMIIGPKAGVQKRKADSKKSAAAAKTKAQKVAPVSEDVTEEYVEDVVEDDEDIDDLDGESSSGDESPDDESPDDESSNDEVSEPSGESAAKATPSPSALPAES